MAELIILHELSSGDPILLNRDAIVKGREHKDQASGVYASLELTNEKAVTVRESLEMIRQMTP